MATFCLKTTDIQIGLQAVVMMFEGEITIFDAHTLAVATWDL
jgi:hypothetical protein